MTKNEASQTFTSLVAVTNLKLHFFLYMLNLNISETRLKMVVIM